VCWIGQTPSADVLLKYKMPKKEFTHFKIPVEETNGSRRA
jgi:hypothetical protein